MTEKPFADIDGQPYTCVPGEPSTKFETEICSRCGGTGSYSYNQIDGSRCFKCHGQRLTYTARGRAAVLWFRERRSAPAGMLKVGDRINVPGIGKFRIATIEPDTKSIGKSLQPDGSWKEYPLGRMIQSAPLPNGQGTLGLHCGDDHQVMRILPPAEHNALRAQALAYQDTLTKAGKPRKEK